MIHGVGCFAVVLRKQSVSVCGVLFYGMIPERFQYHQNVVHDAQAAAMLVVAEQIHLLVQLLTNVDQAVEQVEQNQAGSVNVRCTVNGKEIA